jgi:hypothetical protein
LPAMDRAIEPCIAQQSGPCPLHQRLQTRDQLPRSRQASVMAVRLSVHAPAGLRSGASHGLLDGRQRRARFGAVRPDGLHGAACLCSSTSVEGDHRGPAEAKHAGGPGGQVDAPSLHERTTIIYPNGDASPGRMGSDCDVRAEWSGAMRRGHRIWIHPLARCGSAAAVAIARSDASFGECRCR